MAQNRSDRTRSRRVHHRRALSLAVAVVVVALAVYLAAGSVVGRGSGGAADSSSRSAGTSTQSSSTTTARTTKTTEAGVGPQLSTEVADSSGTASLQQEYQNLLHESFLIRSTLKTSGSKGDGSLLTPLRWPVAGKHVITSEFGPRFHPVLKKLIDHEGFDLAAAASTPISAAAAGKVPYVGNMEAHGKTIIIDHGNGLATVYCHLSHILVDKGETVTSGEIIGKSGSTGLTTGPHLHFEVRVNGTPEDPMSHLH
jgi:murein DD-endopeptidase MepM/ murein hydrolase activator NlpD